MAVLFAAVVFVVAVPAGFAAVLVVFFSVAVVLATLELTFAADFALEAVAVFVVTDFFAGLVFLVDEDFAAVVLDVLSLHNIPYKKCKLIGFAFLWGLI